MDRIMHDGNDDGSVGIGGGTEWWLDMMMAYSGAMLGRLYT